MNRIGLIDGTFINLIRDDNGRPQDRAFFNTLTSDLRGRSVHLNFNPEAVTSTGFNSFEEGEFDGKSSSSASNNFLKTRQHQPSSQLPHHQGNRRNWQKSHHQFNPAVASASSKSGFDFKRENEQSVVEIQEPKKSEDGKSAEEDMYEAFECKKK